jgi:hypothetical protein
MRPTAMSAAFRCGVLRRRAGIPTTTGQGDGMAIQVEFEIAGRTYRVEPGLYKWDIYAVSNLRENIVLTEDLLTGDKIFVAWSSIPVMRLVSE